MTIPEILEQFDKKFPKIDVKTLPTFGEYNDLIDDAKSFIAQSCIDFAKGCVPTKDTTPDADEYERADRMAFNACCQQMQENIERNGKV